MEHYLSSDALEQYISHLSAIETALNEYRRRGSMDQLYALNRNDATRPILRKWLAFANMPELDQALNAMHQNRVSMNALSPYRDIMLHCQTEWSRPVGFIHIAYVHKGSFICRMSDETFTMKPGWCYMFNVNVAKTIKPEDSDAQLLNCLISQNYFENILLKQFDRTVFFSHFLTQSFYTTNTAQPLLKLDTTENQTVRRVFSTAIVEQVNRALFCETAVDSMVCMLMVELLRIYMEDSDTRYYLELGKNKLSDILSHIDDHCASITLEELAKAFHFNPGYLSRIIKTNTGQTFTQVLQTIRMKKAAMLLQSGDTPIQDIAYLVGYHNLTHFYRLFRRSYGISPAEYRRTHARGSKY